jgi:hypothetical protein
VSWEDSAARLAVPYEAPNLVVLGSVETLTLGCDKTYGQSDGFTFQGQPSVCTSA